MESLFNTNSLRCRECALHKYSKVGEVWRSCISPIGSKEAEIILVGQNPGRQEVVEDVPFVGKAGQLLNEMLKKAGINREDIYITNVVKCLTPNNRKPKKPEIEKCTKIHLENELSLLKNKKVIGLLGEVAIKYFLQDDKISKITDLVGKEFWSNKYNCWLLPLYHPSFFLRHNFKLSSYYYQQLKALTKLKTLCHKKHEEKYPKIIQADQYDFLPKLKDKIAVDLETTGLDWFKNKILTIAVSDGNYTVAFDTYEIDWSKIIPELKKRKLIFQNGKFDLLFLLKKGYNLIDNYWLDTKLMAFLLDEKSRTSLSILAQVYLGLSYKEFVDRNNIEKLPIGERKTYCGRDAWTTFKLYPILLKKIQEQNSLKSLKVLMCAMKLSTLLEFNGFTIDRDRLIELKNQFEKEKQKLILKMKSLPVIKKFETSFKTEFNPNSVEHLRKIFYDIYKLPTKKKTKKGNLSVDKDVLKDLFKKNLLAKLLIEYRKWKGDIEKLTLYETSIREDGKIHSQFDNFAPDTSRLASKNPNIQNVPRDSIMKSIFVASNGYKLVYFDYSQIEFRIFIHLSQDPKGIKFLKEGKDIHKYIASIIYRKPIEKITKEERTATKNCVYGYMYGRTPETVADQYEIPVEYAKRVEKVFFSLFRKGFYWLKQTEKKVLTQKILSTPFGTYRRFYELDFVKSRSERDHYLRAGKNFIIQSWTMEIIHIAMWKLYKEIQRLNLDAKFVHQIHDGVILECKENEVDILVNLIKKVCCNPYPLSVPLPLEIKTGKNWYELGG